jgi:DNA-binding GntR family transcriptional regulator
MPPRVSYVRRIVSDIQTQIATGQLQPGDKLPTHAELAKLYDCSEQPVKAALQILAALGALEPHQGKGVYVAERPAANLGEAPPAE